MRRPIILATALAADLAVGALLLAPGAAADDTVEPAGDPPVPPVEVEVPVRSGRSDAAPPAEPDPVEPGDAPVAPPVPVRTGRVAPPSPEDPPGTTPTTDTEEPGAPPSAPDDEPVPTDAPSAPTARGSRRPADPATGRPTGQTGGRTTGQTGGEAPGATDASPTPQTPPSPASTAASRVVVAGDNLWEIAADALAVANGRERRDLTVIDIAPYWARLCMTNRPRLRSGNPSLIYPGEVVELPPM